MNYDRSLIFAYLEEDNIQRAYFRVRPLLTTDGDIRQEAVSLWPGEGGLRIVPDRNEQHTFKTRMRTLGSYCVVDLRGLPAEAGKIRTNKNFRPDRGEVNQFILYSDTVHELPEHTFYQLVDGNAEDYSALAQTSITPKFFIRHEDTLYGPVCKAALEKPSPAEEASGVLFEIDCPDGVKRCVLCLDDEPKAESAPAAEIAAPAEDAEPAASEAPNVPETPEAPAPVEEPAADEAEETLAIGKKLHILDDNKDHEDTLEHLNKPVSTGANLLHQTEAAFVPAQEIPRRTEPLGGTPLVKTPLHVSVQQTKNRTQEIVSNQWSIGKYESPAQNLPAGTKLRAVSNPVESACQHLREAWNATSTHDHLTDFILSLDGMRSQLETKLCAGKSGTIMQHVLQQRLQDLEAERLSALCELDKAKRDVDAYKQELLIGMASRVNKEIGQLEEDKKTLRQQLEDLKAEESALLLQRDALITRIEELQKANLPEAAAKLAAEAHLLLPSSGTPLRMTPVSGKEVSLDDLVTRLTQVCTTSGVKMDRNYAIAVLILIAISSRVGISCGTTAAASTLLKNIAGAMGWQSSYAHQYAVDQHPLSGIRPVDATPAILTTNLANYAPIPGVTKLTLGRNTGGLIRNAAFDVSQWPILLLPPLPYVPELEDHGEPVSRSSLTKLAEKSVVSNKELDRVLMPVLKAATPLSGSAQKEMYRFVSICADLMEGGLPVAADWAISLWVIPALEHGSKSWNAVKPLLDEYPLSLSKM